MKGKKPELRKRPKEFPVPQKWKRNRELSQAQSTEADVTVVQLPQVTSADGSRAWQCNPHGVGLEERQGCKCHGVLLHSVVSESS